jgi:hypothetical protein
MLILRLPTVLTVYEGAGCQGIEITSQTSKMSVERLEGMYKIP